MRNDEDIHQRIAHENDDLPSDADISFYDEISPIKQIEYSRDVLLSYQTLSGNRAEFEEKFPKAVHFGLAKGPPRIPHDDQTALKWLMEASKAPTAANVATENVNPVSPSENNTENSIQRLKEGVLNKTRLLQLKLEQLKLKAATSPE